MVGTVGRTDLLGDEHREELARDLFRALRAEILTLPDDLRRVPDPRRRVVLLGARRASERTTTIGRERATNPLLADHRRGRVRRAAAVAGLGIVPDLLPRLPELNRRGPRLYGTLPEPRRGSTSTTVRSPPRRRRRARRRPPDRRLRGRAHPRARCRSSCGRCSPAGSAGSSSSTGRSCSSLDDDQDRADLVRQCLDVGHEHLARRARRRHRRLDATPASPVATIPLVEPDAIAGHGRSTSARTQRVRRPGTSPARINVELGALADAPLPDRTGHGDVRPRRAGHDRRQPPRRAPATATSPSCAGGPDDWARGHRQRAARPADDHDDDAAPGRAARAAREPRASSRCSSASTPSSAG